MKIAHTKSAPMTAIIMESAKTASVFVPLSFQASNANFINVLRTAQETGTVSTASANVKADSQEKTVQLKLALMDALTRVHATILSASVTMDGQASTAV